MICRGGNLPPATYNKFIFHSGGWHAAPTGNLIIYNREAIQNPC